MQLSLQGKSNKVLSKETTQLMLTPYIDSSVALGVFINVKGGERYFGHNGQDEGFVARYSGSFHDGNGVVIMSNINYHFKTGTSSESASSRRIRY